MKFAAPEMQSLILIILSASLILILIQWIKGRKKAQRKFKDYLEVMLKISALIAISMAALGPYIEEISEKTRATMLIDISESMNESRANQMVDNAKALINSNVDVRIYPFAGKPSPLALYPDEDISIHNLKNSWASLNVGETNIEEALSKVSSLDAENALLISDGYETKGRAENILSVLQQKGVKIFPFAPNEQDETKNIFEVIKLHAPLIAPSEKSVEIRATILNSTQKQQSGIIEIKHDGRTVQKKMISVEAGTESLIKAESDPSKEGIKEVQAIFTPVDPKIDPTTKIIFISGEKREKVLLISGNQQDGQFISNALESQSYRVVSLADPSRSTSIPDLNDFSTVILNNVHINQLPQSLPAKIEQYVKKGGSSIMIGGNQSFGLGGYIGTPVEAMLPVEMVPPQTAKKRLNLAVSLILDKSRSMANDDKIYYAKEAAGAVIKSLKDEDFIEVIGFDSSPFIVIKMAQISLVRTTAIDRVNRLFPAGRTNLLPALHEAKRSFSKTEAGRKHMIILTDGKVPDAGAYYMELIGQLRKDGVTVSTVLIGDDSDTQLLAEMARQGGGAFHQTTNAQSLARIFIDDIRVSTGERTLKESTEFSVRKGTGQIESTSISAFPPVRGYVQTKPKKDSNLELVTFDGTRADPLLASWRYGKGRSIAFTSDANGRWSSFWAEWSKFNLFWSEILDSLRSKTVQNDKQIKFDLRYYVERGQLNLDLAIFSEEASGSIAASLITPQKKEIPLNFDKVSLGHFKATVDDSIAGKYEFNASVGDKKITPVAFYLAGDLFGEKIGKGYKRDFLEKLASSSGGKINPTKEDLLAHGNKVSTKKDLTFPLIALAIFFLLLEILSREENWKWSLTGSKIS